MSGYVLRCKRDNNILIEAFINSAKSYCRTWTILYHDDVKYTISYNNIIFSAYEDYLDHMEETSGGYSDST